MHQHLVTSWRDNEIIPVIPNTPYNLHRSRSQSPTQDVGYLRRSRKEKRRRKGGEGKEEKERKEGIVVWSDNKNIKKNDIVNKKKRAN